MKHWRISSLLAVRLRCLIGSTCALVFRSISLASLLRKLVVSVCLSHLSAPRVANGLGGGYGTSIQLASAVGWFENNKQQNASLPAVIGAAATMEMALFCLEHY